MQLTDSTTKNPRRSLRLCVSAVNLAVLLCCVSGRAESLICDGVLGNSGEQNEALIRFGTKGGKVSGMGVVCDRHGALWDRGGSGTLNRYSPDGRLLAQYKIPEGAGGSDQLAIAGDTLVMTVGGRLFTLSVDAPNGAEVKALNREAQAMSFGSFNGQVAVYAKGKLSLVNAASGDVKELCALKESNGIELGPDGAVYNVIHGKVHKYVDGQPVSEGWPRGSPGERMQLIDGYFYGNAWHGTMRRFTAELEPDPGVILGGASGSFIGHLDQNSELSNGRGMARIRSNLYAVSGIAGVMHLLEWQPEKKQMQIVRRIGAAPVCGAIGLDKSGRIWWHSGTWKWNDRPDAPLEQGIPSGDEMGQGVMLENDHLVAPGFMWNKPAFYFGALHDEIKAHRVESNCIMSKGLAGSAVYKNGGKALLLSIDKGGFGQAYIIGDDGSYQKDNGPVLLKAATPVKEFTTLAMKDASTLLAAGDGAVIEFTADGNDWKETKRWSAFSDQKFGARIFICADAGRLWVSDSARQRVLAFDLQTNALLAQFGSSDQSGADLKSLSTPQLIAARGERAVVHDSGNQRLVKLVLK